MAKDLYENAFREFLQPDVFAKHFVNAFREHADRFVHVMRLVQELQPKSILDVGCNFGVFGGLVRWANGPVERVVGIDLCESAAAAAQRWCGYDTVHVLNAQQRFDVGVFSLVLCMELLEHVIDPAAVVWNCIRASAAHVLFSVPEERGEVDGQFHLRRVPPAEVEALVRSTGATVLASYFLPAAFTEKPRWQGWNYVLAKVRPA